jgi:class 3 adenylate cyclase
VGPPTRYAKSGEYNVAYQILGDGPIDIVVVFGYISHLDLMWESPAFAHFMERLSTFARVILFDKRGTGLSDRVDEIPTLEERMDDVRAVMEAAGSERAALIGFSEGAPMSILFAATYPDRTIALILYGGMARSTADDDYPYAPPRDALLKSQEEMVGPFWGQGVSVEIFSPSLADNPQARDYYARFERQSASPRAIQQLVQMFFDIDVRPVLPSITVPTLVLHRRGDRVVNVRGGRWLADHIPGARFKELTGIDHNPFVGDSDAILDEIQEFLTGVRPIPEPERVLATVMFTDIVDSTKRAAEMGDRRWRETLESHDQIMRSELQRFRGREVKTTGDGFLATFDGPARAIRCALAAAGAILPHGIEIRAGLHCGEVELIGEDIGGIAVHIAARVGALAGPHEVLVSRTVRDLVAGSGIEFEDRGVQELKGVPEPWQIFVVTGGSDGRP